jgi:hypothetical protein
MASFNKVDSFIDNVVLGTHAAWLSADTDVVKAYLSNATPSASGDSLKADLAEIATGNGYTAGGIDIENAATQTAGTITVTATDKVVTATGAIAQFRYVAFFNDTAANDPLVGWYDYGSALDMVNTDTFTINFGSHWVQLV